MLCFVVIILMWRELTFFTASNNKKIIVMLFISKNTLEKRSSWPNVLVLRTVPYVTFMKSWNYTVTDSASCLQKGGTLSMMSSDMLGAGTRIINAGRTSHERQNKGPNLLRYLSPGMRASGDSSVGKVSDWKARRNTDAGSNPRCSKGFFFSPWDNFPCRLSYAVSAQSRVCNRTQSTSVHTLKDPKHWGPYHCLNTRKYCTHW